jgi:ankyrin repeat protein
VCKCNVDDAVRLLSCVQIAAPGLVSQTDSSQSTLLHLAAERQLVGLIHPLIQAGCDPFQRDGQLKTPLMTAASVGSVAAAEALYCCVPEERHDELTNQHKKNAWSALMYACKAGNPDLVSFLLTKGARVNERNKEGATPLYIAARFSHNTDTLDHLVHAGTDVNQCIGNGRVPLLAAAAAGNIEVVQHLITKCGVDVLSAQDHSGVSIFHDCAQEGRLNIFEFVWKTLNDEGKTRARGLRDVTGKTALHYAAGCNDSAFCARLVELQWEVEAEDERKSSPLYFAVLKGSIGCTRVLLDAGASITHSSTHRSILHAGALWGQYACLKTLLDHAGATGHPDAATVAALINTPDVDGHTAIESARKNGHAECVALLSEVLSRA